MSLRSLIRELTYAVGDAILSTLEDYAKNQCPLSQNRALQLIFDVKFLVLLIAGNTDAKNEVPCLCLLQMRQDKRARNLITFPWNLMPLCKSCFFLFVIV